MPRAKTQDIAVVDPEVQKQLDEETLQRSIEALYALDDPAGVAADTRAPHVKAVAKLKEIVEALEGAPGKKKSVLASLEIMKEEEWAALVRVCVAEQDPLAGEMVLDLMKVRSSSLLLVPFSFPLFAP